MLEVMEMEGQQKKMPVNLSGGMKKRSASPFHHSPADVHLI